MCAKIMSYFCCKYIYSIRTKTRDIRKTKRNGQSLALLLNKVFESVFVLNTDFFNPRMLGRIQNPVQNK